MDAPRESIDLSLVDQATLTVAADVFCVQCEYNLRSLKADGLCPECGGAVADSLRSDALWLADEAWLARLRGGFALMEWGGAGLSAISLLTAYCAAIEWFAPVSGSRGRMASLMGPMAMLCLVALVLMLIGAAWVLSPEGGTSPVRLKRPGRLRPHLLVGLWFSVPIVFGSFAGVLMLGYPEYLAVLGLAGALGVHGIAFAAHLRRLAVRARSRRVATLTTVAMWLTGVWAGVSICQMLLTLSMIHLSAALTSATNWFAVLRPASRFGWNLWAGLLIASLVWWTIVFALYRRMLIRTIQEAARLSHHPQTPRSHRRDAGARRGLGWAPRR